MFDKKLSRRDFIRNSATMAAALTVVPSFVVSGKNTKSAIKAPSDRMNIVGIGVGGKGHPNLVGMNAENIIGLCDVDWKYSQGVFKEFPKAEQFKDWRVMFDKLGNQIDGVMVATADHTHATIAANAITMGKHVYCQKPLTHSIYESRLLTNLADKYQVATQMGNQANSGEGVRQVCEMIWNGEIGEIREVHAWTNRPIWPQGLQRPTETMQVPNTLDWDLFLGPAAFRPYHDVYTPWNWRGWWDFGTGAFGDMACHVLDPIYQALKLKYPSEIEGSSTSINTESCPQAEVVAFTFPARESMAKVAMPEVCVTWYDGGMFPKRPKGLPEGLDLMRDGLGGCIFVGSKDTMICDCGGYNPRLLSGRVPDVTPYLRRVAGTEGVQYYQDGPHERDWVRACKETAANRIEGTSNFAYSGPFNEMVLLGVLATRLQALNKPLMWDGENMRFTNVGANEELRVIASDAFSVVDGHPTFDTSYTKLNALDLATECIKHTYREGWNLPAMPR